MNCLTDAIRWHQLGYSPLPVKPDGSKAPAVNSWAALQVERPSLAETIALFNVEHDGLGLICGKASQGLEMLEAEGAAVREGWVDRLEQAFKDHGLTALWDRIVTGYVEGSPSGGVHWHFRVDGAAAKNTKLARRPATAAELAVNPAVKVRVMIETRGEGGFTVIAPSNGRTHGTGKAWSVLVGKPADVPVVTEDERDAIHSICTTLDEMPEIVVPQRALQAVGSGVRPGDDFNERATWQEIIGAHGWKLVTQYGGNLCGWQRPGKRHHGVSATTGRNDADNLFVFSTSTEFDTERPYSKFAAFALLEHSGDFSAAAKALSRQGYGSTTPISTAPDMSQNDAKADMRSADVSVIVSKSDTLTIGANALVLEPSIDELAAIREGPTENGTARALVKVFGDRLRYCPQRRSWLVWSGSRWLWDESNSHRELIKSLSMSLPETPDWKAHKKRSLSAAGVTSIATLASSDPAVVVDITELDARPYELNTPGGIVDLRTGKLRPADPAALHTRTTPVTPDFECRSDIFEQFLTTTFNGDTALIAYVQRLLGLATIGVVLEQMLPFLNGSGANGKTTLVEAVMGALGRDRSGYAMSAPSEMLMIRKHSEHLTELAMLAGARLVVCSELDEGQKFAEARVKMLTGSDSISARFIGGNHFTFVPSQTLILIGNHKPDAQAGGPAFWRRLKLVPFDHVQPVEKRDGRLGEKLAAEAPAVLAWLARGAAAYCFGGLQTPDAVAVATDAYAADQDTIGRFVDERCHLATGGLVQVQVTALRDDYESWCREIGDSPVTARKLTQELRSRYHVQSRQGAKGRRFYVDICLMNDEQSGGDDRAY